MVIVQAMRLLADAMDAEGQPKPHELYKRPDGQLVADVFPLGSVFQTCAEVHGSHPCVSVYNPMCRAVLFCAVPCCAVLELSLCYCTNASHMLDYLVQGQCMLLQPCTGPLDSTWV